MRAALLVLWCLCVGSPARSAEPIAAFEGRGDFTSTLVPVPETWELRWTHDGRRISIRTTLDGGEPVDVVSTSEGNAGSEQRSGTGQLRILVSADGAWTVEILDQASEAVTVHIETQDGGVIQGTLLDRLPDGYLVRVGGVTLTIAYEEVASIRLDELAPEPTPVSPPVDAGEQALDEAPGGADSDAAEAVEDVGKFAIAAWPMQLTFGYVFGLGERRFDTAVGRSNSDGTTTDGLLAPDRETAFMAAMDVSVLNGFALGADLLIDQTSMDLVPAGGNGCSLWLDANGVGCVTFPEAVAYGTFTTMATIWAKPYYALAFARVWAGAGANLALISSNYLTASGGGYGTNSDVGISLAFGAGVDGRIPVNERLSLIGSVQVSYGSPVYDERMPNLFLNGLTWSRSGVGHMVNPLRLSVRVGVGVF